MGVACDEASGSIIGRVADDRGVDRIVVAVLAILIEDVSMSMGESTSLDVLARNADIITVLDQGGTGQCFRSTPVDAFASFKGFDASLEDLSNVAME